MKLRSATKTRKKTVKPRKTRKKTVKRKTTVWTVATMFDGTHSVRFREIELLQLRNQIAAADVERMLNALMLVPASFHDWPQG